PVVIEDGGTTTLEPVALHSGAMLRGSVVAAADGTPLVDVRVEAVSDNGVTHASHPPDRAGRFLIGGLEPGTYTVRVVPDDGSPYLEEVLGGARTTDAAVFLEVAAGDVGDADAIELDIGGEIRGHVANGVLNLVGASVELRRVGTDETRTALTNEFGFYTFVGLPADTYIVYVPALHLFHPDVPREEDARHLVIDEGDIFSRADVEGSVQDGCPLPVSEQGFVTGFVDLDLEKVTSATLRLTSDADTLEMALESAEFFTFGCIPRGTYRIGLFTDGPFLPQYHRKVEDPSRATSFAVDADTTDAVDFEPVQGVTVRGTVRGAGGLPLAGARVRLLDRSLAEVTSVLTDELGAYLIDRTPERWGIDAGTFYLLADSVFVSGPDVTPVLLPRMSAEAEASGLVRLTIELPHGPASVEVERSTDAFAGSETPVVVLEDLVGGADGVILNRTDAPPPGVPSWYRLTADDGEREWRVIAGPVVVAAAVMDGFRLTVSPSPWSGWGPIRIELAASGGGAVLGAESGSTSANSSVASGVGPGSLRLFDVGGREVAKIGLDHVGAADPGVSGAKTVASGPATRSDSAVLGALLWSPRDRSGRPLASGVYYLRWSDQSGRERARARWLVLR
ncbi:MAG: carboxypeptidase-like regulatory domain-containing protein, partial [Candidatus Eisenbacteria bacterium]